MFRDSRTLVFVWAASLTFCGLGSSVSVAQKATVGEIQIPQVQRIDELIQQTWDEYQLKPSDYATDNEWCRRIYLDLLGRIPSVDELNEFVNSKSQSKREALVNRLLDDDRYTEEFARNWTTLWTNLLIGRTGGTDNNSLINREGMQKFLRDAFARNKPYDRFVYELVTATGTTRPGAEKFNGAVNFLIDKVNAENAAQATADTSRLFLGLQVQCTQCHNHPFNDWKQQKYWEMNAFFRQTRALNNAVMDADGNAAELVNQDFPGESRNPAEADLFYELRNGILKVAYPVFVDGTEIPKSGYLDEINRRDELGKLFLKSPYLSKAMTNRTWAHFLGYGFTKPVDDLGPHNTPSHPALLDYLSSEFEKSDYDVRRLMKWIVLSKAYSLSSKANSNNESDDPLLGESPKFTHFYLRQMQAEQLYESLLVATQADQNQGSYREQEARKSRWLQQFSRAFGTDEGGESTDFNGTIPQVLMMFNGELIRDATSGGRGSMIGRLVNDKKMSGKSKVDYLFLAGLSRKATSKEMKMAQQLVRARNGDVTEALKDVWWVVLNSNEFILNH